MPAIVEDAVGGAQIDYLHEWLLQGNYNDTGSSPDPQTGVPTANVAFVPDGLGGTCVYVPTGHEIVIPLPSDFTMYAGAGGAPLPTVIVEVEAKVPAAGGHAVPFGMVGTTWGSPRHRRLLIQDGIYGGHLTIEIATVTAPIATSAPSLRDDTWHRYIWKVSAYDGIAEVDDEIWLSGGFSQTDTATEIRLGMAGEAANMGNFYAKNLRYRKLT